MNTEFYQMDLSPQANEIIQQFDPQTIIDYREELSHDGYDVNGPESNLWDLFILTYDNDRYFLSVYHDEDWFQNQSRHYALELKLPVTTLYDYSEIYFGGASQMGTKSPHYQNLIRHLIEHQHRHTTYPIEIDCQSPPTRRTKVSH